MNIEPHDHWRFYKQEDEKEAAIEAEERAAEEAEEASRLEALAEYPAHKKAQRESTNEGHRALSMEQDECPHDEHDHGICLDCGKDIFDDLVARADFLRDE